MHSYMIDRIPIRRCKNDLWRFWLIAKLESIVDIQVYSSLDKRDSRK